MPYSTKNDITDELIFKFSTPFDHQEAEEYVDKVLSKLGIAADEYNKPILLKQLAVCYATYKRSFYESKTKEDIFYQKYLQYEEELKSLTSDVIRQTPKTPMVETATDEQVEYIERTMDKEQRYDSIITTIDWDKLGQCDTCHKYYDYNDSDAEQHQHFCSTLCEEEYEADPDTRDR